MPSNRQILISASWSLPCPCTRPLLVCACWEHGRAPGHSVHEAVCHRPRGACTGRSPPRDAARPPRRSTAHTWTRILQEHGSCTHGHASRKSTASWQPGLGIRGSGVQTQPLERLLGRRSQTPGLLVPGTATLLCALFCFNILSSGPPLASKPKKIVLDRCSKHR